MTYFRYQLHGLGIASEIELPEASGTEPEPEDQANKELIIRVGRVPREVRHFRAMAGKFEVGDGVILLRVPGIGGFFMERGEMVTVEAAPGVALSELRSYILSMALGVTLLQRGHFVLHGGACVTGSGALAFLGYSGLGKSTTTSAFAVRGYPILTDDLLSIRFDEEGRAEIYPGLPTVKLLLDTADFLMPGLGAPYPQASCIKRQVHLPNAIAKKPARLRHLLLLSWLLPETAPPICRKLEPMASISVLRQQCFYPELITPLGHDPLFLDQAVTLVRSCSVWRLLRPAGISTIERTLEAAENPELHQ